MRTRSYRRGQFELFPKLPPEIRRQIWKGTIVPRLLPSKPIAELSVCRESRAVLLEVYEPCFHELDQDEALMEYPISLYANFAEDILVLDMSLANEEMWDRNISDFLVPDAMRKIQHLAIPDDDWRDLDPEDGMLRDEDGETDARLILIQLTGLKTLSLIASSTDPFASDSESSSFDSTDIDRDRGSLIKVKSEFMEDDYVIDDAATFLAEMEDMRPGWKAPELQLARIVYS